MPTPKQVQQIEQLCGDYASEELLEHFELVAALPSAEMVNLLGPKECLTLSKSLRSFHPVAERLGGIVLDDPDTSNHHLLLTVGPCAGAVLYLDHDGDTRIVYADLASFREAAQQAMEEESFLGDLQEPGGVMLKDQPQLSALVAELLEEESEESSAVILALLPSLNLSNKALLMKLASSSDFFVVEALAMAIALRPKKLLKPIAELCAKHKHPQVARAGKQALAKIK